MKSLCFATGILIGILAFISTEIQAQCNHRQSFDRSPVADSIDAIHYQIALTSIDFTAQAIEAIAVISLRPKLTLTQIPLELKSLTVSQVNVNGNPAESFSQSGDMLRIATGNTYGPGDTITVEVHYGGQPFHEAWGGFHFAGNYAFNLGVGFESEPHNLGKAWFPCIDDFNDRATYDVLITLPDNMKGIAGGSLVSATNNGDNTITWHWNISETIPTYLASVVAGEYALNSDVFSGMEAEIPITIYTRPVDSARVAGSFQHLHEVMQAYEAWFNAYPFERIGYSGTAIGAMEHVCNIAYPHTAINGNLNSEYLLAHELSHMWFGNKVTCSSAADMWLNEGWATFCHHYYRKAIYGEESYRAFMNDNHYDVLKNVHITDNGYYALSGVPTQITYGSTVYNKGATVVHTLMNYLGESVFLDVVKAYLDAFAYGSASSIDMRDFFSEQSGVDLTGFFDNWVFTPGTPHFSIDSVVVAHDGNAYRPAIHMKQKHKGAMYTGNDNILEVSCLGPEWQVWTDTVHFDGPTGVSIKEVLFEPQLFVADLYNKTCDATTDEQLIVRQTGEYVFSKPFFKLYVDALPDSAYIRITHHWAPPDSLKQAVEGLRLSPYRYWQVAGIFPENTQMRGRFFYSDGNTLDNTLIQSENDSVVILYRSDAGHDWQWVSQSREGLWSIGYIYVDQLLPGEYSLAVWDRQLVGLGAESPDQQSKLLQLSPNPAGDTIMLTIGKMTIGKLMFYDVSGRCIHECPVNQKSVKVNTSSWTKGVYVVKYTDQKGKFLDAGKFLLK
ncbi:MAG: T9SS type A sorting domain-containing protein [Bacteroidales bacterium]|nr:T9SS type A sorting domain-containing protein [Bacteroidales bacterium]